MYIGRYLRQIGWMRVWRMYPLLGAPDTPGQDGVQTATPASLKGQCHQIKHFLKSYAPDAVLFQP